MIILYAHCYLKLRIIQIVLARARKNYFTHNFAAYDSFALELYAILCSSGANANQPCELTLLSFALELPAMLCSSSAKANRHCNRTLLETSVAARATEPRHELTSVC